MSISEPPAWSWRERAGVVALGALLAVVMTYPVAFRMEAAGRVDTADGEWSLWNVAWIARTLVADPTALYDANIFYPERGTLAYSEPNFLAGLLAAPVYWWTGNPYVAYNVVLLSAFVLSFLCTYALARHLTGDSLAALVPAVAFAFCPFVFARVPHIHLQLTAGIPLAMLALHRWVDRPNHRRSIALGLALALQGLGSGYYGIFVGLAVGLGVLYYGAVRGTWRDRRYWRGTLVAVATLAVIILPPLLPFFSLQGETGFSWDLDEARQYSADWRSYLASPAQAHAWLLGVIEHWNEVLFPGFLATALAGGGVWMLARPGGLPGRVRETAGFYTLLGGMAFWASLGPNAGLYTLLYQTMPAFSLIRAPARMAILVVLSVGMLGVVALSRWLAGRPARVRVGVVTGLTVLMALELASIPIPWYPAGVVPGAYRVLARMPQGPVVEFPFFGAGDYYRHASYMLASTEHWFPLINGYGNYMSPAFRAAAPVLGGFPSDEGFALLRERGARYATFHVRAYGQVGAERLDERLDAYRDYLQVRFRDDPVWLYEIVAWPDAAGTARDGP